MTSRTAGSSAVGERVRRLAGLPREVATLSEELAGLRTDVAALRQDVLDLGQRLPQPAASSEALDEAGGAEESPFDDGIELFAERIATLEDGLDDVAQRLESMTRDGVNQLTGQIESLKRRMDELTARPSLTQEQLEEALSRVAGLSRSSG
jgi:chromosome segregation ATPase